MKLFKYTGVEDVYGFNFYKESKQVKISFGRKRFELNWRK